jgi:hypothetical protein
MAPFDHASIIGRILNCIAPNTLTRFMNNVTHEHGLSYDVTSRGGSRARVGGTSEPASKKLRTWTLVTLKPPTRLITPPLWHDFLTQAKVLRPPFFLLPSPLSPPSPLANLDVVATIRIGRFRPVESSIPHHLQASSSSKVVLSFHPRIFVFFRSFVEYFRHYKDS